MTTAIDVQPGKLFIVDAHRSDTHGRFIVQSGELLTAFLEIESTIRAAERPEDCGGREIKFDKLSRSSKALLDFVIR